MERASFFVECYPLGRLSRRNDCVWNGGIAGLFVGNVLVQRVRISGGMILGCSQSTVRMSCVDVEGGRGSPGIEGVLCLR